MTLNDFAPAPAIASYVRVFRIIDFNFAEDFKIPLKAYPPRPEDCLQFFPAGGEIIKISSSEILLNPKQVVVVGQHTGMIQRHLLNKRVLSIQIVFQPGALAELTKNSSSELRNRCIDATDLFGSGILLINEQLAEATNYHEQLQIVGRFVSTLIKKRAANDNTLNTITGMMLNEHDRFVVEKFSKLANISFRQFDRNFRQHTGLSPKTFLQLVRFDKAFRMKNRCPEYDWLKVAIHSGYHDYQHLVKDYKTFTGFTPVQFLTMDNQSPERSFGDAEV